MNDTSLIMNADPNQAKQNLQNIASKLKIIRSRKTFINILKLEGVDYVRVT